MRLCLWLSICLSASWVCADDAFLIGGPAVPEEGGADTPASADTTAANIHMIPEVPAYIWYHGCGPTSTGMIIGYWDAHGFDNLIVGGNDWTANLANVQNMIASPGHIRDYVPTPDRTPTLADPYHADDCLADFVGCSRDPLDHGWSYLDQQSPGMFKYVTYRGYDGWEASYTSGLANAWQALVQEVNAYRPAQLMVDSNGDGALDHFVTAIGYDDTPGANRYAFLNTWDSQVHWAGWHKEQAGNPWGVYAISMLDPVPEPSCALTLLLGIALLRKRRADR